MPKVLNTGTEDRVCSFSQYRPTLADEKHFLSVTKIFSLKTVNDLTESVTHFHRLLMNEV